MMLKLAMKRNSEPRDAAICSAASQHLVLRGRDRRAPAVESAERVAEVAVTRAVSAVAVLDAAAVGDQDGRHGVVPASCAAAVERAAGDEHVAVDGGAESHAGQPFAGNHPATAR